jgi:hypothetical protein
VPLSALSFGVAALHRFKDFYAEIYNTTAPPEAVINFSAF